MDCRNCHTKIARNDALQRHLGQCCFQAVPSPQHVQFSHNTATRSIIDIQTSTFARVELAYKLATFVPGCAPMIFSTCTRNPVFKLFSKHTGSANNYKILCTAVSQSTTKSLQLPKFCTVPCPICPVEQHHRIDISRLTRPPTNKQTQGLIVEDFGNYWLVSASTNASRPEQSDTSSSSHSPPITTFISHTQSHTADNYAGNVLL